MKVEYPKWVYKPNGEGVIVKDEAEHEERKEEGYGPHPSVVQPKKRGRPARSED